MKIFKEKLKKVSLGIIITMVFLATFSLSSALPTNFSDIINIKPFVSGTTGLTNRIGSLAVGPSMLFPLSDVNSKCINQHTLDDSNPATGTETCISVTSASGNVAVSSFDVLNVKNRSYFLTLLANLTTPTPVTIGTSTLPSYVLMNINDIFVVTDDPNQSNESMIVGGLKYLNPSSVFEPRDAVPATKRNVCADVNGKLITGTCSAGQQNQTHWENSPTWSACSPYTPGTCSGGGRTYTNTTGTYSSSTCADFSSSQTACLGAYGVTTMPVCTWTAATEGTRTRSVTCHDNATGAVVDPSLCNATFQPAAQETCPYVPTVCNLANSPTTPRPFPAFGSNVAFNDSLCTDGGMTSPAPYDACFIAGTQVTMADGSTKNIEDIKVDDVLKGSTQDNPVMLRYVIEYTGPIYSMNNSDYFVSASHPFMTTDGWKSFNPAATNQESPDLLVTLLKKGDVLVRENGVLETLEKFDYRVENKTVYNFGLNGSRDYYADGYLVHNVNLLPLTRIAEAAAEKPNWVTPNPSPLYSCPSNAVLTNGHCCWAGTTWNAINKQCI